MAAVLQLQMLKNFFGDFDHRINELTGASERWEVAKLWILENFQTLVLVASAILFPAFVAVVLIDHWDQEHPPPVGCKKLGVNTGGLPSEKKPGKQQASRHVSPIEGCRSIEVNGNEGIDSAKYDHQFGFAQSTPSPSGQKRNGGNKTNDQWQLITDKDYPRLLLLDVQLWVPDPSKRQYNPEWEAVKNGGSLVVSFPFPADFALSSRYADYLYSSLKTMFIRRSWSAKPVVTFEVPFLPTAQRMQRKSYAPDGQTRIWKDSRETLDMANEISAQALVKLRDFLGVRGELSLFRKYTHD